MILSILAAMAAINILVLTHELGHFLIAKYRGIIVEVFSIGFGPKVFGVIVNGTEYRIGWLLFGGYVKMKGDEPEEQKGQEPGGFYSAGPFTRILVCFAGGLCNILFALVLYTVISFSGKPVSMGSLTTIVGGVMDGSAAEEMGILPGDRILGINGKRVNKWEDIVYAVAFGSGAYIEVTLERNGRVYTKNGRISRNPKIGIRMLGIYSRENVIVYGVKKGSSAEKAGIKEGDRITAVDGRPAGGALSFSGIEKKDKPKEITLTIERGGRKLDVNIPVEDLLSGKGIIMGAERVVTHPGVLEQFCGDLSRTWMTLRGLLTKSIPVKAVSGPVGIVGIIGISMKLGFIPLLAVIALISLNLGIINLLPIPVLDGGHIMFNVLEMIRKKPLSAKTILGIQNVFMAGLIALALYVTYNDVLRWFR